MYTEIEIRASDGNGIKTDYYLPARNNGRVIVLASGAGITKEFYRSFALFLSEKGYPVFAFNYRGTGNETAPDVKKCETNLHQWAVKDLDAVILHAVSKFPKQELIFIGHCVGGEIAGLARASEYISKIILISSALSCKKLWPIKDRIRIFFLKRVISLLSKVYGFFPGKKIGFLGNLPAGVAKEWSDWCDKPNGLFDYYPDNNYRKLRVPLLAFSFKDDWHCPPRAVQELLNRFLAAEITWHHLKPAAAGMKKVGHNGFFKEELKASLWAYLAHWINKEEITIRNQTKSWVVGFY